MIKLITRITGVAFMLILIPATLYSQTDEDVLDIYEGSRMIHDDNIGFEAYSVAVNDSTLRELEGYMRRQFARAPEGRSPLEIIRNYESAILSKGGEILFSTRDPGHVMIDEVELHDHFYMHRIGHTRNYEYMRIRLVGHDEYLSARIPGAEADVYVALMTGRADNATVFELVTLHASPMDMGMVTLDLLYDGLANRGRVAIYDIFFDTGESAVKESSSDALEVIAQYLNENPDDLYLVVGHTDNVGDYVMNLELSERRAKAVANLLISEYGVEEGQILAVGVGPAAPVLSNDTDEGRARNRRVEIVEL